jgi:hypothetical protein
MKSKATLKQIAKELLVSVSTVSKALNDSPEISAQTKTRIKEYAKLKNYKQSGMPQQAASLGLEYRDPKFWWIGANINYLGNNFIDVAPILRTDSFIRDNNNLTNSNNPFPEVTLSRTRELLKQQKFADFNLLNLTGGKSWRYKEKTLGFFASVNNVLDTSYKTGGYEQARNANYRELNIDTSSGTPSFAPKYFYGFGRTYFVNLYLSF